MRTSGLAVYNTGTTAPSAASRFGGPAVTLGGRCGSTAAAGMPPPAQVRAWSPGLSTQAQTGIASSATQPQGGVALLGSMRSQRLDARAPARSPAPAVGEGQLAARGLQPDLVPSGLATSDGPAWSTPVLARGRGRPPVGDPSPIRLAPTGSLSSRGLSAGAAGQEATPVLYKVDVPVSPMPTTGLLGNGSAGCESNNGSMQVLPGDNPDAAQHTPAWRVIQLEAQIQEFNRQLQRSKEEQEAVERRAAEREAEVRDLQARVAERDAELLRLRALHASTAGPPAMPDAARVAQLEAENAWLRDRVEAKDRAPVRAPRPDADGAALPGDEVLEAAARRLQSAARPWIGKVMEKKRESGNARDRWKQTLQAVEDGVNKALETAVNQTDVGRVPRQTRLQMLANTMKQGVLKVNQAMMQQTLQDMRRSPGSGYLSPTSGGSEHGT